MEAIYKELKETLDGLQSPFEDDVTGAKVERKFSDPEVHKNASDSIKKTVESGTIAKIEDIDVSYEPVSMIDTSKQEQVISVDDEKVKDRWSRYIGAMGIEAVAK
jgi:hypothetical protein